MQVYEIMNVDIKTISKDSSILEAMKIMKEKNTDFLIVCIILFIFYFNGLMIRMPSSHQT